MVGTLSGIFFFLQSLIQVQFSTPLVVQLDWVRMAGGGLLVEVCESIWAAADVKLCRCEGINVRLIEGVSFFISVIMGINVLRRMGRC